YVCRSHIGEVTAAGQSSFLPKGAESIQAIEVLDGASAPGGATSLAAADVHGGSGAEEVPAVIVFDREGGLSPDDLNAIGRLGRGLGRLGITGATPIVDPFSATTGRPLGAIADYAHGVGPISKDGEAALLVLALNAADRGAIRSGVTEMREYL